MLPWPYIIPIFIPESFHGDMAVWPPFRWMREDPGQDNEGKKGYLPSGKPTNITMERSTMLFKKNHDLNGDFP